MKSPASVKPIGASEFHWSEYKPASEIGLNASVTVLPGARTGKSKRNASGVPFRNAGCIKSGTAS
jgi:hypothetical protein